MSTIRERVMAHMQEATERIPDEQIEAGEVFYQVGGKSWPTFCREVRRMEREGLIALDTDDFDGTYIGIPDA